MAVRGAKHRIRLRRHISDGQLLGGEADAIPDVSAETSHSIHSHGQPDKI
jgi:hypothetical protein